MKEFLIVGVDVSKEWLDLFILPLNQAMRITNNQFGFRSFLKDLKKLHNKETALLVVMEHTGRYSFRFESFLQSKHLDYCKIAALEIKKSMGMTRGKTDKTDASRIAEYGWLRRDKLKADEPLSEPIMKLKSLLSLRSTLVRARSGYISRLKEVKACMFKSEAECKIMTQMIAVHTKEILHLDQSIKKLIAEHDELNKNVELLRSIKGIGWIIAAQMISTTNNFKKFQDARKFNCYAGIAPFKHESGKSIYSKSRVSHMANKQMKTLLNLAAFCAIRCDNEMKSYYKKRVGEGKNKMSSINIIRAKLVSRMFAVIKRQTPYQTFQMAA